MPPRAAPRSMKSVPPWTRGDFRGVLNVGTNPPWRCATAWSLLKTPPSRHPSNGGDFQRSASSEGSGLGESLLLCRSLNSL